MGPKSKKQSKIDSALNNISTEIHERKLEATAIKKKIDDIEKMLSNEKHKWWFKDKDLDEYYKRYEQLKSVYHKEIEHSVIIIETDGVESQRHKDSHYHKEFLSTGELIEVVKEETTSNTTSGNTIVRDDPVVVTETNLIKKRDEAPIEVEAVEVDVGIGIRTDVKMNINQSVNINDCNSNSNTTTVNLNEKSRKKMIKYSLIFFIIVIFIILTIIACLLLID